MPLQGKLATTVGGHSMLVAVFVYCHREASSHLAMMCACERPSAFWLLKQASSEQIFQPSSFFYPSPLLNVRPLCALRSIS